MVTVAVQLVLVGLILVQAVLTTRSGITAASDWHQRQLVAADVAVNIDEADDSLVQNALGLYGDYPTGLIRQMIATARSEHLSLFDTPLAAKDTTPRSVPVGSIQHLGPCGHRHRVGNPRSRCCRRGLYGREEGGVPDYRRIATRRALVLVAKPTPAGWIAYWDTTTVADGTYEVQSVVAYPDRARAASAPISVTVENKRA